MSMILTHGSNSLGVGKWIYPTLYVGNRGTPDSLPNWPFTWNQNYYERATCDPIEVSNYIGKTIEFEFSFFLGMVAANHTGSPQQSSDFFASGWQTSSYSYIIDYDYITIAIKQNQAGTQIVDLSQCYLRYRIIESIVPPHQNEVEIGGRWYPYVQIGNQLWLAENLDYKFEVNGSPIPIGSSESPTTPAAWYYNNDESVYGIDGTYKCGLLYNWYAAKYLEDNKATLLPDEWHVPTSNEFDILATNVGGISTAGTKLKALDNSVTSNWPSGWNGTDDYGFAATPSGYYYGSFSNIDNRLKIHTITDSGDYGVARYLTPNASIDTNTDNKTSGGIIRLVRTLS